MPPQWTLVACVGTLIVETLAYFWAPTWLARLAFIKLNLERRLPLPDWSATSELGYRDRLIVTLPPIDLTRSHFDDAVLVQGPPNMFALRRLWGGQRNRFYYLVRIDVTLENHEVVLRARQAPYPFFGLLLLLVLAFTSGLPIPFLVGILAVIAVQGIGGYFIRGKRDAAIEEAYDTIERELRPAPPRFGSPGWAGSR